MDNVLIALGIALVGSLSGVFYAHFLSKSREQEREIILLRQSVVTLENITVEEKMVRELIRESINPVMGAVAEVKCMLTSFGESIRNIELDIATRKGAEAERQKQEGH